MAVRRSVTGFALAIVLVSGCRTAHQVRDPDYAQVSRAVHQACHAAVPTMEATSPVLSHLEGPHPVEEYIHFALAQNPDIQAARKRMEAFAHQVPVTASQQ